MALLTCLSFIFFSIFLHNPTTAQRCPTSCPGSELELKFPFGRNPNGNQNGSCSYPGFGLSCSRATGEPILKLPESGEFSVRYIDYEAQQIWIDDPDSCLPKRMLENFNLSGTPFGTEFWYTLTFFNCSTSDVTQKGLRSISCLSDSNYSVLVSTMISTVDSAESLPSTCQAIKAVTIPFVLDGIRLDWNEPNCRSCVERRGDCGFTDRNSLETGCFNLPSQGGGLPRGAKYGIIIGAGIPGLLCLIGLVAFAGSRMRHRRHQRNLRNIEFSTSVSPSVAIVMSGLDGQTIESYPKTKLGDSGRLPKPNDNTCPICLSEYQPKETLRTIPECNHYFHADCIDEWLKMNGSCPLCRNSPSGSAPITPSITSSGSSSSSSLLSP
ncbi:hypothetical protein E1A91_D03G095000v1 [Gossypium mustelinum]|uniref:RING-type E3 ubiquitin transferase n=1 Tax=Gossypium mustelinum TaxID=34275 RepID=A0A5D2VL50_GOSMU|nr:hypothetical protein E1A91_D03G095000v1 [Gossypium mustelinum]